MGTFKNFCWSNGLFVVGYHLLLLFSLPVYFQSTLPSGGMILATAILFLLGGLGITAGYHRFYSHRTYQPNRILEAGLLSLGTLAVQGSALQWANAHRLHHKYVDTDRDPYVTYKGFWHSHLLWMFKKREDFDKKIVGDLLQNRMVVLQHTYYGFLVIAANAVPTLFIGWLFDDYWGAFLLPFLTRMFLIHHSTWFINSLAHMWGSKPFSTEHSAVNNWIIAVLTLGEGYHNYHHTFQGDYRNGVRWYQYDVTKFIIWSASKLGLAKNLRKVSPSTIRKRLLLEDRKLMYDKIDTVNYLWKDELKKEIDDIYQKVTLKIAAWDRLARKYNRLKKNNATREILRRLRAEIKTLKKSIRKDSRSWAKLCKHVLTSLEPFAAVTQ